MFLTYAQSFRNVKYGLLYGPDIRSECIKKPEDILPALLFK